MGCTQTVSPTASVDTTKCEIISEYTGRFTSEVGKPTHYFDKNYIESLFLENQTFGASTSYNIPDSASVFLILAAYQGSAGTNILIEHKITGNAVDLDITYKTDLIAAAVMNQPFYLITTSANCKINVISEQHSNPDDIGQGLVKETPIKE
ncbi:hypothetical protein OAD94_02920 [Amylibacter sp.]|nr:hypothetical protein [Amylibacter sp.]